MQLNGWQGISPQLGGICRSKVFELWRSGELASVKIGSRRFSTDSQIAAYVSKLEAAATNQGGAV